MNTWGKFWSRLLVIAALWSASNLGAQNATPAPAASGNTSASAPSSAAASVKAIVPDFSGYKQTDSFKDYLGFNTSATLNLQRANLLVVSAFPNGYSFADEYSVSQTGREFSARVVYNWATQAATWKQLSEADLKSLRSAIHGLPSESTLPPIERLVIVSFADGSVWVTRAYDSSALPQAMRQIYDIIGERFESKQMKNAKMPPATPPTSTPATTPVAKS